VTRAITVEGMSCGGCEEAVETALEGVDGVTSAAADRETGRATVESEETDSVSTAALVAAVEAAGFTASA
jgi:copper chaperone CopZ